LEDMSKLCACFSLQLRISSPHHSKELNDAPLSRDPLSTLEAHLFYI
jgi:hypothetical protein